MNPSHPQRMPRPIIADAVYFTTCATHGRRRTFSDPVLAQIVVDQWLHYETAYAFRVHAYSVLPDHYHIVLDVGHTKTISQILHAVNSYIDTQICRHLDVRPKIKVWQGDPWDEVIRNEEMYWQKVAYTLFNPWRAGLVTHPLDAYPYSDMARWRERDG